MDADKLTKDEELEDKEQAAAGKKGGGGKKGGDGGKGGAKKGKKDKDNWKCDFWSLTTGTLILLNFILIGASIKEFMYEVWINLSI